MEIKSMTREQKRLKKLKELSKKTLTPETSLILPCEKSSLTKSMKINL